MERVILVYPHKKNVRPAQVEDTLSEAEELVRSAGGKLTASLDIPLDHPSPSHYIKQGRLEALRDEIAQEKVTVCIFAVDLTPTQARNIEEFCGARVVDRTGLILDIFARRATSREGKLQVELAQLEYLLPRLAGKGVILSRLGGGIGTRGPGEQKLEVDRRKIRDRIGRLKEELSKLRVHRGLLRKARKRRNFFTVSLVGYTNAGKSTLMNRLTDAGVYVEDKLFATLDPRTRLLKGTAIGDILFTDTVGFLISLPHGLIEAFQATLEEIKESDLIVHVLDISHPNFEDHFRVAESVLKDLGCEGHAKFLVLNKADQLPSPEFKARAGARFPDIRFISALTGEGIPELKKMIFDYFEKQRAL
ncbi:MAG: GTPase HflX [Candidatus Omnitrophica bacterium]|nr:GTPase HflX [Candidatus Omnitrophota bacterium]